MNSKELAVFLLDNQVYDSYQYFVNTINMLKTAVFCKDVISSIVSKMESENADFQKNIFERLTSQTGDIKNISVFNSDLPKYELEVSDVTINAPFLLDKLVKDFFQYIRNSFESMAQSANASCLANIGESVEKVGFLGMNKKLTNPPLSIVYPELSLWFSSIAESDEYMYIQDFNNRTKHICDVYIEMSMAIIGENQITISPFYKQKKQYKKQDLLDYLTNIYSFVEQAYSDFMRIIKLEIVKQKYIDNRFQTLTIYQQKFRESIENSFSIAYIETSLDFQELPETIRVLFVKEIDGKIIAKNCPLNNIYFKKAGTEDEYICKYNSVDKCRDDTLLEYRKYKKEESFFEPVQLRNHAMLDVNNKTYYHSNPFVKVITVSDDDDFKARVNLPI